MEVFDVSQEDVRIKNKDIKDLGIATLSPRKILQTSDCSAVKKMIITHKDFRNGIRKLPILFIMLLSQS